MDTPEPSFVHRFEPGDPARPPILLLHGTGGDEADLLPVGRAVAPGSALLSPRGKVLENGRPRFFRRFAEGVFDEEDVRHRAAELAAFVAAARAGHGLAAPVALGFSNGANIAAALLLEHPETLAGAVLLRPMVPLAEPEAGRLDGRPVLLLSGDADPIAPPVEAARLERMLAAAGASVERQRLPAGHGLTRDDLALANAWLERHWPPAAQGSE